VVLLILAGALVIGDRIAKSYAQGKIAQQIQTQATLATKPSVNIEGFPFLTQLAAHDLRKVDISARDVREGKIDISAINATASGVHLNSSFSGATVDQVNGRRWSRSRRWRRRPGRRASRSPPTRPTALTHCRPAPARSPPRPRSR